MHACRHELVVTVVIVNFLILVALPQYDPQNGTGLVKASDNEKKTLFAHCRRQRPGFLYRRHLAGRGAWSGIYAADTTAGLAHTILAVLGGNNRIGRALRVGRTLASHLGQNARGTS